jgi:hypothetical protein
MSRALPLSDEKIAERSAAFDVICAYFRLEWADLGVFRGDERAGPRDSLLSMSSNTIYPACISRAAAESYLRRESRTCMSIESPLSVPVRI